jgi:hypothetical protein
MRSANGTPIIKVRRNSKGIARNVARSRRFGRRDGSGCRDVTSGLNARAA